MSEPQQRRRRRRSRKPTEEQAELQETQASEAESRPGWLLPAAGLFPLVMLFLGTGESGWEQGLAALLLGLILLIHPPRRGVPLAVLLPVGGFLLLALLPLLPLNWPGRPDWWVALTAELGVDLGRSWSPQPWVTLEAWTRTALCLAWMTWWITLRPHREEVRSMMRLMAGGIALAACAALLFRILGWEPKSWNLAVAEQFGPLANRNVFAALMSVGAVAALAAAYDLQRKRSAAWIPFALLMVPMFAVVVLSTSRAGIAVMLLAVVLWFALASLKRGAMQRMAVGISLVLAATSALVIFGRPLLNRFIKDSDSLTEMVKEDGRAPLFLDTLRLAREHTGLGAGLGNFEDVYAMTRQVPELYERFRHPESDWLWLLFETGLPATALLLLLTGLLTIRSLPRAGSAGRELHRGEGPLRSAALVAGCAALIHSMMNPVLHALPFFLVLAPFAGMGVSPARWSRSRQLSAHLGFRALGAVFLCAAGLWWTAEAGMTTWFGQTAHRRQLQIMEEALSRGETTVALQACDRAVSAAPLNWAGYFDRASTRLAMGNPAAKAVADFAVARFLEPSLFSLPMDEARLLMERGAHQDAVGAWREALRRTQAEDQLHTGIYADILGQVRVHPELREEVRSLATTPAMLVQYLGQASDDSDLRATLQQLLDLNPSLDRLSGHERRRVLSVWYEKGDRAALMQMLESDPLLMPDGWQIQVRHLAENGKPGAAYDLAMKHLKPPVRIAMESSRSLAEVQRDMRLNPNDPRPALSLFHHQLKEKRLDEAAATLAKVQAMPGAPRYLDYEFAKVLYAQGEEAKAWEALQRYIQNNPES